MLVKLAGFSVKNPGNVKALYLVRTSAARFLL